MGKAELRELAARTLRANDRGGWTVPSPRQYPHQWNWDSGFAAIGWARIDPPRGALEIETLLRGRWRDGMVPHVRYNRQALADYFPGPDRWPGVERHVLFRGQLTSGITNPPIAAMAANRLGRRLPEPARSRFWEGVLAPLGRWLRWFARSRTLPGSLMPVTVHPWETGWDNSPRWDALKAAQLSPRRAYRRLDTRAVSEAERPQDRDYDAYLAVAELLAEVGYDLQRYQGVAPFLVHDVALDAIWYRACRELNQALEFWGRSPAFSEAELQAWGAAFDTVHWDEDTQSYLDYDLVARKRIRVPTAAGLVALLAGRASSDRARSAYRAYLGDGWRGPVVPTVRPDSSAFEPARYWRGPVWVNVNWLVVEGLRASGLDADAETLREATLALVRQGGMAEYFDAADGRARGASDFTWTAALTLDLLGD